MAREDIPLDLLDQTIRWGRGKRKEKKRKRKEREEEGGERSSTFSLEFPAIGPSEQEAKLFHVMRASHRDKNPDFSTDSVR